MDETRIKSIYADYSLEDLEAIIDSEMAHILKVREKIILLSHEIDDSKLCLGEITTEIEDRIKRGVYRERTNKDNSGREG